MIGTAKQLIEFFEKYYGEKYSGVVFDTMISYLSGYTANFYKATAEVMVKRFSRVFNKAPGPAEIEKHWDEISASIPRPVYLPKYNPKEEQVWDGRSLMDDLLDRLSKKHKQAVKP